jgi:hypothetical protein
VGAADSLQLAERDVLAVPATADLAREGGGDAEAGQPADGLGLGDEVAGGQKGLGAGQRDEPEVNPGVLEPKSPPTGDPAPVTEALLAHGRLEVRDRDRPEARRRPRAVQRDPGCGQLRLGQQLHLPLRHTVAVPVRPQAGRVGRVLRRGVQAVQPAARVGRVGQCRVQLSEFADGGLVRHTLQQNEDVDVAAGGAEVAGDQRAVQVHADQAAARQQRVPQPIQQQGDVRGKLRPVPRHQRSG